MLKGKEIRPHGAYRTHRLVLEAWERLESLSQDELEDPAGLESPAYETKPRDGRLPPQGGSSLSKDEPASPNQTGKSGPQVPPPSDYGLYRCSACGKLVLGFDKESHQRDAHRGQRMGFEKV